MPIIPRKRKKAMNEANQIGVATNLYGFIAVEAQQNRFAVTMNRLFKAGGDDAMMIPMNIREDDFYFTLSNMKRSQVKGAVLGAEYQKVVLDLLEEPSSLVQQCGFCDIVTVSNERLRGDIIAVEAVMKLLAKQQAMRIAVIGSGALAKAIALRGRGMALSFFHEHIESLLAMAESIALPDIDINRCAEGMAVDLGGFDAVIDASSARSLSMVTALPKLCIDLKAESAVSALRQRCSELQTDYTGYEQMLPYLTQSAYEFWQYTKTTEKAV
jgi:shikimate 5-dehydrogenase